MAKPLKIVLFVLGGLLLLLVAAAVALPLLFDPNRFRVQISEAARAQTGRSLELGHIELRVFPWLRVAIDDAVLGNAQGFGDAPFAQVRQLGVGVKLMPLLTDRRIEVSRVTLDGLRLNLAIDETGRSNWQDLLERRQQDTTTEAADADAADDGGAAFELVNVEGVTISDAVVRYRDARAQQGYRLEPFNLKTGTLVPGEPVDVEADLVAYADKPKAKVELRLRTTMTHDASAQTILLDAIDAAIKARAEQAMGGEDVDVELTLGGGVSANTGAMLFETRDLKLDAKASGKAIAGGAQRLQLSGKARYDQKQDTLVFDDGRIEAAGIVVTTQIRGEGLTGERPRLSGPIAIAPFSPRALLGKLGIALQTADDKVLQNASLTANYSGSFNSAALDALTLKLDDTTVQGRIAVTDFAQRALELALRIDAIDADRYLPPKTEGEAAGKGSQGGDIDGIELPTEALEALNASGTVDIGKLTIKGLKLDDVRLTLAGSGDAPKTQALSAKLYGGNLALSNRYSASRTPEFAIKTRLDALNAAPFLKDLLGKDHVSGLGNLALDLTGRGTTVGALRRSLNGSIALEVQNGAVKGFNLGQILRQAEAMLAGQAAPADTGPLETDFATLRATANIVDGVLKTDDLTAASPLFRLAGSGEIDLVRQTIRFIAKPTVVETSKGQGGKGLEQLRGLTIPIEISGNLFAPSYKLALEDALKQRARDALQEKLAEKLDLPQGENTEQAIKQRLNEKLGDKLGELLGGGRLRGASPAPTPTPTPPPGDAAQGAAAAEPSPAAPAQ
ncbi:AsmA family protein [Sinimarinibacterium thermocellulolyticum]|uniref:AsmA family protein n=1 Tax=Sinimarinibacterium thermocellulolyticum TaxID=3170016 RepID=A0ABV2AC03_9GAMM